MARRAYLRQMRNCNNLRIGAYIDKLLRDGTRCKTAYPRVDFVENICRNTVYAFELGLYGEHKPAHFAARNDFVQWFQRLALIRGEHKSDPVGAIDTVEIGILSVKRSKFNDKIGVWYIKAFKLFNDIFRELCGTFFSFFRKPATECEYFIVGFAQVFSELFKLLGAVYKAVVLFNCFVKIAEDALLIGAVFFHERTQKLDAFLHSLRLALVKRNFVGEVAHALCNVGSFHIQIFKAGINFFIFFAEIGNLGYLTLSNGNHVGHTAVGVKNLRPAA